MPSLGCLAWLSRQRLGLAAFLLPATLAYVEKPLDAIPAVLSRDLGEVGRAGRGVAVAVVEQRLNQGRIQPLLQQVCGISLLQAV